MSALQKFKTFFSKNVLLCLTVPMVVFSLLVPQPFVWMGQNISIDLSGVPFLKENFPSFGFVNMLLCVIMFGMGMTLKADDFKYILKKPTDVLIGICASTSSWQASAGLSHRCCPSRVWVPHRPRTDCRRPRSARLRARRHRVKRHDVPCKG